MTAVAQEHVAAPAAVMPARPYPGLRPFAQDEWPIFFGREVMVDEAISRLGPRCLLLVHGSSGAGKSSLIRAGVLPRLLRHQRRRGVRWATAIMRPSGGPLLNLAEALADAGGLGGPERVRELRLAFDKVGARLSTIAAGLPGLQGRSLCLLIDQFEELFQFAREGFRDEARLFAELVSGLLEEPPETPLRAVLTMRSEYLGECASLPGLAGVANANLYLVPRMEPEGLRRAIRRPAELYGGEVTEDLAERLIADEAGDQDALPLIQHGLMRLWSLAPEAPGRRRLDLALYDAHGPLARLLDAHAEEVLASAAPTDAEARIAEAAFRALTDTNADGQAIRRRQRLHALAEVAGTPDERVAAVLEPFRADEASFLVPPPSEPLGPGTMVDVGHEALIRCWQRLSRPTDGWHAQEVRDGLAWRILASQAEAFSEDPKKMLGPAVARDRARWIEGRTEAWSRRYGGRWDEVRALIAGSLAEADRQQERDRAALNAAEARAELEAQARAAAETARQRIRRWLAVAAIFSFLTTISTGFATWQMFLANRARREAVSAVLRAEQLADEAILQRRAGEAALARANKALARGIWSDLRRDSTSQLNVRARVALWRLTLAPPAVKRAFIAAATEDADVADILVSQANLIVRALWPAEAAPLAATVLDRLRAAASPFDAAQLGQALAALAERLGPAEAAPLAAQGAAAVLERLRPGASPFDAARLGQALAALAERLGPAEAAPLAAQGAAAVLERLRAGASLSDAARLGQALAALAERLGPAEAAPLAAQGAAAVLERLRPGASPFDAARLGQALAALAERLGPAEAAPLAAAVLERLRAAAVLEQLRASPVFPSAADQLGWAPPALAALAERLGPAEAAPLAATVLERLRAAASPFDAAQLGQALAALAERLGPAEAAPLAAAVLARLRAGASPFDAARLGQALAALAERLGPAEAAPLAAQGAAAVLERLRAAASLSDAARLEQALAALAERLGPAEAAPLAAAVLERLRAGASLSDAARLGQALAALAERLGPAEAAPLAAQGAAAVLDRLRAAASPFDAAQLGQALAALAERLGPAEAAPLAAQGAAAVLERLRAGASLSDAARLGQALAALAERLGPAEAAPLAAAVLERLRAAVSPSAADQLGWAPPALAALAERLGPAETNAIPTDVRDAALSELAWEESPNQAQIWARLLVAWLPPGEDDAALRVLAAGLRAPIAEGLATEVLLGALHTRYPAAPGPAAGLRANAEWLRASRPGIDLFSGACPPPPRRLADAGAACPPSAER